eukprot:gene31634-36226_t
MHGERHERGHALAAANAPGPGPAFKLTVQYAYGSAAPKIDPLQSFSSLAGSKDFSDRLLYKIGRRLCVYDSEMQSQVTVRPKNVVGILHFSTAATSACARPSAKTMRPVSPPARCPCTYNLLNTCHYPLAKPFVCSTFCGDRDCKQVAELSETDGLLPRLPLLETLLLLLLRL